VGNILLMEQINYENLQKAVKLIEEAKSCIARKDYIKAEEIAGKILECEVAGYPFYASVADIYNKTGNRKKAKEIINNLVNVYKKLPK
jgi:thiaminase